MPMAELTTKVSLGATEGKKVGNLILEDARFYGRPNFSGELDQFKDDRRKFTVRIPNELADQLREMGWNVKTLIPTAEELEQFPDREMISFMKIFLNFKIPEDKLHLPNAVQFEKGPEIIVVQGDNQEKLTSLTVGMLDRSRIKEMGMEIRAWEYDPEDNPGKFSARLVQLVAVLEPNLLLQRYGITP